jgi:hypothetical protein
MKKFSVLLLLGVSTVLAGCAADTGIVRVGRDTYMMGRQGGWESSGSKVRAGLYKDASLFCEKAGKNLVPVSGYSDDASHGKHATAEIHFRCSE